MQTGTIRTAEQFPCENHSGNFIYRTDRKIRKIRRKFFCCSILVYWKNPWDENSGEYLRPVSHPGHTSTQRNSGYLQSTASEIRSAFICITIYAKKYSLSILTIQILSAPTPSDSYNYKKQNRTRPTGIRKITFFSHSSAT